MDNHERQLWEPDDAGDPQATPPTSRKLITQPYDLTVGALLDQIERGILHLKPLSGRPKLQRRYVWPNGLASRLIESMLLNVPIPPCYFAQDADFENEVIDGQQRLYSLYRFHDNQFALQGLETLSELNGKSFFQLPRNLQNKMLSYTLRCVVITNDSDDDLRFDVFERLNSNTVPLNAQELRNCVYRGAFIELLSDLAENKSFLEVLRRKEPDSRMRGEELILRFFAFKELGLQTYRTPQKFWLNSMAEFGQKYDEQKIEQLRVTWLTGLNNAISIFGVKDAFRRPTIGARSAPINKALVDMHMLSLCDLPRETALEIADEYQAVHNALLLNEEFSDLISRAVDHKSRTTLRFALWNTAMVHLNISIG
ncbi:DUF262 domain-containing protein [Erythrobacter sp. W302b]|uniref:DUF262 domain-containing protein n=1 Tax=Erythrobacter sp. W302b TaxID=3389874 RepID=UPI00396B2461